MTMLLQEVEAFKWRKMVCRGSAKKRALAKAYRMVGFGSDLMVYRGVC